MSLPPEPQSPWNITAKVFSEGILDVLFYRAIYQKIVQMQKNAQKKK